MKKEILYILKRVIIGVLIAIVLFSIKSCTVKALSNGDVVNGLTIPASSSEARFFSLNSNGIVTEKGYSLLSNGDILYAIPSTPNYTYGTGGGAISLCNLSLVNNYYYGVTYYFASAVSNDFVHPYYTSFTDKLGIYSVPTGGSFDFTYVSVSNGVQKGTYPGLTPVGDTINSYTVIFKANKTDTCLYSAFSSSSGNLTSSELAFLGYSIENLGSQALTEQQITNIITNANSQVIINDNANTNRLLGSITDLASSILSGQQQSTEDIIDSQQVCNEYSSLNVNLIDGYLNAQGVYVNNSTFKVSDYIIAQEYIDISSAGAGSGIFTCFYKQDKTLISCTANDNLTVGRFNLPTDTNYLRFTFYQNRPVFNYHYCVNGNQATTDAINDLNDSITSEAPPNLSSLNNSAGWLPPGPVDSILNLPLALLNNVNTNLSKTCQPVILHIPLVDRDLPIPCITTLYEQMGIMTWVNTIGAIASAFILFSYFIKLYKWVDDTLTFRENNYIDNWGGV